MPASAQDNASPKDIVPTGTLRAVFLTQNPVQGRTDPNTGDVTGPAADLTALMAKRLGVPFTLVGVGGTAEVMQRVRDGSADIGFLAFDAIRAAQVSFTQTYALAQNTFLVPQDSPLRTTADIDQTGIKVGVGEKDAADFFLTRTLRNATLSRNAGGELETAYRQLMAREIDAYAANRQRLHAFVASRSGVRLLPDNFYGVEQAIVVRKGNDAALAAANAAIDEARASGVTAQAISRAGLVGVDVAQPPGSTRR